MEMFLMVLALSLVGTLVSAILFAVATRDARGEAVAEERFFVMRPAEKAVWGPAPAKAQVLALQIERHVRLEFAAAESFTEFPSAEALHMPTLSPLAG